ncbi:endolytic transglycosylase MltG, partial [Acinetobacter baumannii]
IYGITGGTPLGRGIRASELAAATPYNTYVNYGLPPGPIGNPGRAALAAVMDPPDTEELYFVANGTGGHSFSRTYGDQSKNVAQWRQIEKSKAS